jgi:hypothetical protein
LLRIGVLTPLFVVEDSRNRVKSNRWASRNDCSIWLGIFVKIETVCDLENFRRFMILSTCQSFMPDELAEDNSVFPERASQIGTMYVEAEDKETVQVVGDISFTRVSNVLGIIYNSKSGRTKLKWRSVKEDFGKLTGEASPNSLVNLYTARVLSRSYAERSHTEESANI